VEPQLNRTGTTPPIAVSQRRPPRSPRERGGLLNAGKILAALRLVVFGRATPALDRPDLLFTDYKLGHLKGA
jgi:hypothetical protein